MHRDNDHSFYFQSSPAFRSQIDFDAITDPSYRLDTAVTPERLVISLDVQTVQVKTHVLLVRLQRILKHQVFRRLALISAECKNHHGLVLFERHDTCHEFIHLLGFLVIYQNVRFWPIADYQ